MARYVFRLPDIGEGIAEAEIVAWHIKPGDRVEEDARLADMMTDKATVEMESPVAGTVLELAGEVGDRVPIGSALVVLEVEGEEVQEALTPTLSRGEREKKAPPPALRQKPSPSGRGLGEGAGRVLAAPAVRARAKALGIDLAEVSAGPAGRIRHADLDALLAQRTPAKQPTPKRALAESLPGAGEQIKVIGLRRRIAEKMAESKRHIPHFSYVEECDVTALEALRAELNALHPDRQKLTILPLLITAICRAVPRFPMINARYDDEAEVVTRYASVHLGIATQTETGLMVPVVRDAQSRSLWQLASEIARLSGAARDGSITSEELSGSTLTITSLGPLGGIATAPVINWPEVAIIGPNRIVERPVFVPDGQRGERVEKRKLMNLSISCDHRVVDGYDAASFVQEVKRLLEAPLALVAG